MQKSKTRNTDKSLLLRILPLHKLMLGMILSIVAYLILLDSKLDWKIEGLFLWIVFSFTYLLLSWLIFFYCSKEQMPDHAGKENGSRWFVLLLILISSFAGMLTVVLLVIGGSTENTSNALMVCVALVSMFTSWFLVHTTYAFHYAHLFYDVSEKQNRKTTGGLNFPGEENPNYLDFAYFSFGVGTTFQVSDVEITSTIIRRWALFHCLLSFALNTVVVALTFNLIAGLIK